MPPFAIVAGENAMRSSCHAILQPAGARIGCATRNEHPCHTSERTKGSALKCPAHHWVTAAYFNGANRKVVTRSPSVPTPGQSFGSNVQPEKACNEENDDDDADDVKNVHGVLRWRCRDFGMKSVTSN
jgi:hypothetical protein